MRRLKKRERVVCVENDQFEHVLTLGKMYWVMKDEFNSKVNIEDDEGFIGCFNINRFERATPRVIPDKIDQPTLSDFDRIRADLSSKFFVQTGGMETALEYADYLIGLVVTNPFPYQRTDRNPITKPAFYVSSPAGSAQ